jgi:hypothetical protein
VSVRRLREELGYTGGKSAVYELVPRLRPATLAPAGQARLTFTLP